MPNLNFVLPHWLYWGTLIVFPLVAIFLVKRQLQRGAPRGPSLFIAYLFWLCSGFLGLHRFYLRSLWDISSDPLRERRHPRSPRRRLANPRRL